MATVIDALVIEFGLDPAKLTQGQKAAIQSLKELGDSARARAKDVEGQMARVGEALTKLRSAAMGFGAAILGAASLTELIKNVVSADAATQHMARVLGISTTTLAGWGAAAKASGVSAQSITSAFASLNDQITQMQYTGVPFEGLKWINSLNISLQDGNGRLKTMDKLFTEMADTMRVRGYTLAQQGTLLRGVFGGAGDDMLKMIDRANRMGLTLEQFMERQKQLQGVTAMTAAENEKLADRWNDLMIKGEGLARALQAGLIPVLEALADWFQKSFEKGGMLAKTLEDLKEIASKGLFAWLGEKLKEEITPSEGVPGTIGGDIKNWIRRNMLPSEVPEEMGGPRRSPQAPTGAGPGRGTGQRGDLPVGTPTGSEADRIATAKRAAMDQLRREGVPEANLEEGANLLVGQALSESRLNPRTVHDQGTGYGIYGARLDRRENMLKWLKENNYPADSLEGQMRYMAHEGMSGAYPRTRRALSGATAATRAQGSATLTEEFERPAVNNYDERLRNTLRGSQVPPPNVSSGAVGGVVNSNTIDESQTNTDQSRSTKVDIHSMNVTTPNAEDFSKQLKPILEGTSYPTQGNYGIV